MEIKSEQGNYILYLDDEGTCEGAEIQDPRYFDSGIDCNNFDELLELRNLLDKAIITHFERRKKKMQSVYEVTKNNKIRTTATFDEEEWEALFDAYDVIDNLLDSMIPDDVAKIGGNDYSRSEIEALRELLYAFVLQDGKDIQIEN